MSITKKLVDIYNCINNESIEHPKRVSNPYVVDIYIGGELETIQKVCGEYCDENSYCVSIVPTKYVYNGSRSCDGAKITLINYARFPETGEKIEARAIILGLRLREACQQTSFSIVSPSASMFYSKMGQD